MAVAGAIVGAAIGGWSNDRFGRKVSIMVADFLFLAGSVIMASAPTANILILGRVFVGLGVGMASMTAPLYISEASPARIRGALVSTNSFLITGGQFLSYLINLAFTKGKEEDAKTTLRKIYPANEVEAEIRALHESVENEAKEKGNSEKISIGKLLKTRTIRRGILAGVGLQIFQQFVGINTVMYYSPTIVQLAGFASNQTALALSLVTSGLNAAGSIVSIYFIDRTGRRKLMVILGRESIPFESIIDDVLAEFAPDENDREERRRKSTRNISEVKPKIEARTETRKQEVVLRDDLDENNGFVDNGNDVQMELEKVDDKAKVSENVEFVENVDLEKNVALKKNELKLEEEKKEFCLNAKIKVEKKENKLCATEEWKAACGVDGNIGEISLNVDESSEFELNADGLLPFYIIDAHEEAFGGNLGVVYLFGKVNVDGLTQYGQLFGSSNVKKLFLYQEI